MGSLDGGLGYIYYFIGSRKTRTRHFLRPGTGRNPGSSFMGCFYLERIQQSAQRYQCAYRLNVPVLYYWIRLYCICRYLIEYKSKLDITSNGCRSVIAKACRQ